MNSKLLALTVVDAYDNTENELVGITPFLKSIFLVQHELSGPNCYDFQPGDYGPFNSRLYADIGRLVEQGFLTTTDVEKTGPFAVTHIVTQYNLTEKGRRAVELGTEDDDMFDYNRSEINAVIDTHADQSPYDLLETVNRRAPGLFTGNRLPFTTA